MPEAPRPDWRNADADASKAAGARAWQARNADAPAATLPSRRTRRRAIAVACLVGLAIGIGILLSYLKGTRPACLVVVGSGYEHNLLLPHNVYGWNGATHLLENLDDEEESPLTTWVRQAFGQRSGIRRIKPVALAEKPWPDVWQAISKRIDDGDAKEQVILFISAHGYADEHDAYLLRDVAAIKSPEEFNASRVPISEVLGGMKVHKEKSLLLILDVCHVQSHWPIGMLQNDFAERLLKKYRADINAQENLTVICSVSPGQRSWVLEDRQTSVFAEFVSKGLRGEGKSVDEPITASGLFDYVKKNVNEWAKVNRAREQVPILIGGGRDADLGRVVQPKMPDPSQGKDETPKASAVTKFNPADLSADWQTWQRLKKGYAPQVYAPHYWQLYQETLLRYEQLLRAGDPTMKADELKKKLASLETDIKAAKSLDKALDCLGNSFPMARVLGFHPNKELAGKELQAFLAQLKANPNDRQKIAALKPFAGLSEPERRYWQTRLSRLHLEAQLKQPEFDRAGTRTDLAEIAKDLLIPGNAPASAEVHLVKMLQDVDPALDQQPDLVKLAVQVRIAAEEAALGGPAENDPSELYAEVIFKRLQQDVERADAQRREGEDRLFGDPHTQAAAARENLVLAQGKYAKIRLDAQQMRKALALRDDIAAELPFLARSLAVLPPVGQETADRIKIMRATSQALGENLAQLTSFLEKADAPLPELKSIEKNLGDIRANYRGLCETLNGLGAEKLQLNWHAMDAALSIPPATAADKEIDLRIQLLTKLGETSRRLAAEQRAEPQDQKPDDTVETQRDLLRGWLTQYAELIQRAEPRSVDDHVRDFLLGQFKKTDDARADIENEAKLQAAAGSSRVLLGALAEQLKDQQENRINPVKLLRNLRTYQLLQGLAERTLEDHWCEPDGKGETTYYGPAAGAYLDGAARLLTKPKDEALLRKRVDLVNRLKKTGLKIAKADNPIWTTEESFVLKRTVDADGVVPRGMPTVWFEAMNGKPKERQTVRDWLPHKAEFSLGKAENAGQRIIPVRMHALYRGQHLTESVPIECPPPNVIARHTPGPEKVAFAVRMDKLDYGAISIVLDNSGSMGWRHPKKGGVDKVAGPGEKSRYNYATEALKQVLGRIPDGTPISILNFGGQKVTEPILLEPPKRWNQGRIDNVMAKLEGSSLNNDSPIANAILKSMEEGFPKNFKEPMLILVLTDGMDNCSFFPKNQVANTDKVIDELRNAGIRYPKTDVVVVCFLDQDDNEYVQAKQQFQRFTKNGDFIQEAEGAKLGKIIEDRVMRPRVQLRLNGNLVPGFEFGRSVNYASDSVLEWKPALDRNDYQAGILNSSAAEFDLKMTPGHNIFAILTRKENKYILERGVLGLQPEVSDKKCLTERKGDWLVTLLKNEKPFGVEARRQLIAFEKAKPEAGSLRQTHPGLLWLELETQDGVKPAQTLEWGSDLVVPAAAYAVEMAGWPGGDPKLTAWFWPGSWNDLLANLKPIERRLDIKSFVGRPDDLIESIRWEKRPVGVMTPAGKVEIEKDCLVVRARYLAGKPVYVALKDKNDRLRVGSEHQFFHDAGKGTACFYDLPITLKEVELVLIDVARFKDAATQGGTKVEFTPRETITVPPIFRDAIIEAIHGKRQ